MTTVVLLFVCDRYWGRERRPRGALTGVLLVGLFAGRAVVEQWKEAAPNLLTSHLSTAQLLSLSCVAVGAGILWRALQRKQRAGWVVGG